MPGTGPTTAPGEKCLRPEFEMNPSAFWGASVELALRSTGHQFVALFPFSLTYQSHSARSLKWSLPQAVAA